MPYIKQEQREGFSSELNWLFKLIGKSGELNYCIYALCKNYMERSGISYSALNEVIGVLECCKQEFYRRVVVPYEEKKKDENGDV